MVLDNEPSSESRLKMQVCYTCLWDSCSTLCKMQANSQEELRINVAVLDQQLTNEVKKLKSLFPEWVDVVAYSSFMSTYTFWFIVLASVAMAPQELWLIGFGFYLLDAPFSIRADLPPLHPTRLIGFLPK